MGVFQGPGRKLQNSRSFPGIPCSANHVNYACTRVYLETRYNIVSVNLHIFRLTFESLKLHLFGGFQPINGEEKYEISQSPFASLMTWIL